MTAKRFWYRDGRIEDINSASDILSRFLLDFGQGLHIAWRTSGTRIPFFHEQFSVLMELVRKNQIVLNHNFDDSFLKGEITRLLNRNRIFKGALVHLIFLPQKSAVSISPAGFYMATENWDEEKFILNSRGFKLGWMKGHIHPGDWLMPRIGSYHQIQTLWSKEQKSLNWDAGYFTDKNGIIVECNNANIFMIKGTHLYTPSLNLGITPRAIRKVILRLAPTLGLQTTETKQMESAQLESADEIFIAGDKTGISWVVGYGEKRYFRKYSELFNTLINREWAEAN